jgi:hypothetical protein
VFQNMVDSSGYEKIVPPLTHMMTSSSIQRVRNWTQDTMNGFTFFWITATFKEVEEHVLRTGIHIEVSRVSTSRHR